MLYVFHPMICIFNTGNMYIGNMNYAWVIVNLKFTLVWFMDESTINLTAHPPWAIHRFLWHPSVDDGEDIRYRCILCILKLDSEGNLKLVKKSTLQPGWKDSKDGSWSCCICFCYHPNPLRWYLYCISHTTMVGYKNQHLKRDKHVKI